MARTERASGLMWPRLFRRFEPGASTRQGQLRDMLLHAMTEGFISPGVALPSSRVLARTLGLSRTTVTLALQSLIDQGFVVGRARSGYFVAEGLATGFARREPAPGPVRDDRRLWRTRLKLHPSGQRNITKPENWQREPYPFIYGQFDASLFPFRDWRACVLESLQARAVRRWAPDGIDRDDDSLVEQIHARLLPARGIWAGRDEILVTGGAQQATWLLAALLVDADTRVGIELPGYPDARNIFALRTRHLAGLAVDAHGLVPSPALSRCDYVYVTPSHQCPTTVTMSIERRQALLERAERDDFIVIEDDHESELNFSGRPTPALKSLDANGRVLYCGSLSKTLAHGLRLGFIVAPAPLVVELRALRRLVMRHVATNNQIAAASFIAHGYHEAFVRRLNLAYRQRATALTDALARHAPSLEPVTVRGGSALWVGGPAVLDTRELSRRLAARGVIVEPGDVFFPPARKPCRWMRIGYSSIPVERIEDGVRLIADELRHLPKSATPARSPAPG